MDRTTVVPNEDPAEASLERTSGRPDFETVRHVVERNTSVQFWLAAMASSASFVIVGLNDFSRAGSLARTGHGLIAGSVRIAAMLRQAGIEFVAGRHVISDEDGASIVELVGTDVATLEEILRPVPAPEQLKAFALANFTRAAIHDTALKIMSARLGGQVRTIDRRGKISDRGGRPEIAPTRGLQECECPSATCHEGRIGKRPFWFDFRSVSGKKLSPGKIDTLRLMVRPMRNAQTICEIINAVRLTVAGLGGHSSGLKFSVPRLAQAPNPFAELRFAETLGQARGQLADVTLAEACEGFYAYRSQLRYIVDRYGTPVEARFNLIQQGAAGFVAALAECGIRMEMTSHGCMVSYGEGPRHELARILGGATYNSMPGMTHLAPRSPLQIQRYCASQEVVARSRRAPPAARPSTGRPFLIYYAPNFITWEKGLWGLSINCFETLECIEALTGALRGRPDFALKIRIKTTPADLATRKHMANPRRGLLPVDIEHLVDPAKGIEDASKGSHQEYIDEADLVVSEGRTVVLFEALEARKPVLLLRSSPRMVPSLPHMPVASVFRDAPRAAVYAASLEDDLGRAVSAIRERHCGRPLTDTELQGLVW